MHTARDFIFLDEGVEYPHQGMERGEDRNGIAQEVRLDLDEKTLAAVRGTVNYISSALKKCVS